MGAKSGSLFSCDICPNTEVVEHPVGESPGLTNGWSEFKLNTYGKAKGGVVPEHGISGDMVLCPMCTMTVRSYLYDRMKLND